LNESYNLISTKNHEQDTGKGEACQTGANV